MLATEEARDLAKSYDLLVGQLAEYENENIKVRKSFTVCAKPTSENARTTCDIRDGFVSQRNSIVGASKSVSSRKK